MYFLVELPRNMIHSGTPWDLARVLRSHVAHLGAITVTPISEHSLIYQAIKRTEKEAGGQPGPAHSQNNKTEQNHTP